MKANNIGLIDRGASGAFFRAKRGRMSLLTISGLSGVSKASVCQWERGAIPSVEAFVAWCRARNADPGRALTELLNEAER